MTETWHRIGSVRSVRPSRRELRVEPASGHEQAFEETTLLRLLPPAGTFPNTDGPLRCPVAGVRSHGGIFIVAAAPGVPRDLIARLKGATVVAAGDEAVAPRKGLPRGADLLEFDVRGEASERVGVVTDAYTTPAHDILEIEAPDGRAVLLPIIEPVVSRVDWEGRVLVVGDVTAYAVETRAAGKKDNGTKP